jgi:eukaryotic-like serine/threonine-protein kinase
MIGTRLGKWVLDKEIGRGGMGRVYLSHEDPGERLAAIKVLSAELAQEPGFLQRFEREIEILNRLGHPNIVKFFESGAQDGHFYYAMEFVEGESFEEILHMHGRVPWKEVLDAALQICPALKHAHDHGVIHRDLKPPNLMRTPAGTIKLTDFGIAKVFAGRQLTTTGGVVGTAEYLSPEQASGKPATKRSDLYSLGAVLYMLLTGRTPFSGVTTAELLHKHLYARFEHPQKLVPEIPHELDNIICQLLEKDPARRPPDSLVLHRQLDSLRRKMERKGQLTLHALSKDHTMADNRAEPPLEPHEGPATFMSRMVRSELEELNQDRTLFQWSKRPWVLATMFACCVGVLAWAFWPQAKPSTEALFQMGKQKMESSKPEEWGAIWNEYLEPLNRDPANTHHEEIQKLKQKIDDRIALRRVLAGTKDGSPMTDGHKFYLRGERLCREGDFDAARQVWQSLVDSFQDIESEDRWVQNARDGLSELERIAPAAPRDDKALRAALERARSLKEKDKKEDSERIIKGLLHLYQGDPSSAGLIKQIEGERNR